MRIRPQGSRIQLLRVSYSSEKKRSQDTFVTSFNKYAQTLPDAVRELLEPQEIEQVERYLAEKNAVVKAGALRGSLMTLPHSLDQANTALQDPAYYERLTPEIAAQIWDGLDNVRKSLRRAGFQRPKKGEAEGG